MALKIKKKKAKKPKITIGRSDKVDLPLLDIFDLEAKVDSGAYTSALHCSKIKVIEEGGDRKLQFMVLDRSHPAFIKKMFTVSDFKCKMIRNSSGQGEERFVIRTDMVLFGKTFDTEISLSRRGNLKFPLLIGRRLLQKGFVVDVNKYNLSYKSKMRQNENRNTIEEPGPVLNNQAGGSGEAARA